MQNIGTTLTPGAPTAFQVKGLILQIVSSGNSAGLTIDFYQGGRVAYTIKDAATGWRMRPNGGFDKIDITSATADTISAIVTSGDIDIQITEVASTIGNTAANPVPVSIISEPGEPFAVTVTGPVAVTGATLTATNVGINNTDANPVPVLPAINATVATVAPVPVAANATGTVVLAADATRRGVRFYNPQSSAGPVAITPDNATPFANAAVVLYPGDFWNETEAPGAAWFAATPAATAAEVNVQTVKA